MSFCRLALALLALTTIPSFGQVVVDPLEDEELRRSLEERTNQLGTFSRAGGAPDPGPSQARGGPCFEIEQITVEGVTAFDADVIAAIVYKYVPNCMQGADIQAVMRELDALYADNGYITSKTYIPGQNLQSKQLVLTMLEGTVEDVFLIGEEEQIKTPRGDRQLKFAFPKDKNGLFQLRDYEQGLDQMNRLTSVEAVLQLQPGQEAGGSFVIVQRVQTDPVRAFVRLDNQGSTSTGKNTLAFDLEVDDLVGLNDSLRIGYSGTENTNALSLFASIPYGYWTFETNIGYSEYLSRLDSLSELFGTSNTASITAKVVAQRSQFSKTELSASIATRKSERFINDAALTPQRINTVSLGLNHLQLGEKARNSFDAKLTFGTAFLGDGRPDANGGPEVPDPNFQILEAGWQRQGALGTLGTLVTDLRGQYSLDTLFGSEQMSFGSFSTVRGHDRTVASGDRGAYIRNDLYLSGDIWASVLPEGLAQTFAQNAQTHLFFDAGVAWDRASNRRTRAAAVGLGLSYYTDRFTVAAIYGVPLLKNEGFSRKGVFQLRVDFKAF